MKKLGVIVLALLLGGCGRAKSTGDWVQQLHDTDAALRLEAIRELGRPGAPAEEVVPALAEALKDRISFVRRDAAAALGRLGPEARAAVPSLLAARADRERSVRRAVADALKAIDPAAAAKARVK